MPRVIFKCPYIRGGSGNAAAHLDHYTHYIATREGAERITSGKDDLPVTKKQTKLVAQILRDFPLSRGMFEYEDYLASPTRGNATEFITRALEDNLMRGAPAQAQRSGLRGERRSSGMDELSASVGSEEYAACDAAAKRENYVQYIAQRPRAERLGDHALFTGSGDSLVLSHVAEKVSTHPGNVWLPIISLRREDAQRLGYNNAEQWRAFLSSYAVEMAKAMNIPLEQFRWYAAYHDEGHHPHIHMVCYSEDAKHGYLTKEGIAEIKAGLAKRLFRDELTSLYARQTERRDELVQEAGAALVRLIHEMESGTLDSPRMEQLMTELAGKLKNLNGKKQYGYLKAPLKALVDEIVDELAKDPRVAKAYELWYTLRAEVLRTYREDIPDRLPLSQQKEFKRIKNIVIEEAVRLGTMDNLLQMDDPEDAADPMELTEEPPMVDAPPDVEAPREAEHPPVVEWNFRYKLARSFLYGSGGHPQDHAQALALFNAEALNGNALAMHDLGRMYADGLGCDVDMEQSRSWYAKALAAFRTVDEAKPGRYVEYRIGKMYAAGLGTERDHSEAAEWFIRSAGEGYKYAQYSLAGLYLRGKDVPQDYEKAHHLYTQAASQLFPYAAFELGKLYRDGLGCDADTSAAARWFGEAYAGFLSLERDSHDDKLQYRIGWMLLHGVGTEKNESEARTWLEKAARLGNHNAQYCLAKLILSDPAAGVEQTAAAIGWLTKAAEAGQDAAQYAIGKFYRDSDPAKAAAWFQRAAESGNDFAAYALGKLLLDGGDGLPKDIPTAMRWLTHSAEAGNQHAQYRLGKLLLQGEAVPKDVEQAIRWLTAAAEQGDQYAQYTLGKLYLLGKEVPRDENAAVRWFTLSASQGDEYAQYFLDHLKDFRGPSLFSCATQLLRHMGNIFREQTPWNTGKGVAITDRKLRQKIREKKIAMGHKADDHAQEMTM